jgi:hypothetical protein
MNIDKKPCCHIECIYVILRESQDLDALVVLPPHNGSFSYTVTNN